MVSCQGIDHLALHHGLSGRAIVGVVPGSCLLGPPEHTCSDGLGSLSEASPSYPHDCRESQVRVKDSKPHPGLCLRPDGDVEQWWAAMMIQPFSSRWPSGLRR